MGIAERKIREFERREQEILEAAFNLFIEKGLADVTIEMIASAAEIGKGTIYKHFKSKHDIFAHLLIDQGIKLIHVQEKAIDRNAPVIDQLRQFYQSHFNYFLENQGSYKICQQCERFLTQKNLSPSVLEKYNDVYQRKKSVLNEIIKQAVEEKIFIDYPISDLTLIQCGMFFGAVDAIFSSFETEAQERQYQLVKNGLINAFLREKGET